MKFSIFILALICVVACSHSQLKENSAEGLSETSQIDNILFRSPASTGNVGSVGTDLLAKNYKDKLRYEFTGSCKLNEDDLALIQVFYSKIQLHRNGISQQNQQTQLNLTEKTSGEVDNEVNIFIEKLKDARNEANRAINRELHPSNQVKEWSFYDAQAKQVITMSYQKRIDEFDKKVKRYQKLDLASLFDSLIKNERFQNCQVTDNRVTLQNSFSQDRIRNLFGFQNLLELLVLKKILKEENSQTVIESPTFEEWIQSSAVSWTELRIKSLLKQHQEIINLAISDSVDYDKYNSVLISAKTVKIDNKPIEHIVEVAKYHDSKKILNSQNLLYLPGIVSGRNEGNFFAFDESALFLLNDFFVEGSRSRENKSALDFYKSTNLETKKLEEALVQCHQKLNFESVKTWADLLSLQNVTCSSLGDKFVFLYPSKVQAIPSDADLESDKKSKKMQLFDGSGLKAKAFLHLAERSDDVDALIEGRLLIVDRKKLIDIIQKNLKLSENEATQKAIELSRAVTNLMSREVLFSGAFFLSKKEKAYDLETKKMSKSLVQKGLLDFILAITNQDAIGYRTIMTYRLRTKSEEKNKLEFAGLFHPMLELDQLNMPVNKDYLKSLEINDTCKEQMRLAARSLELIFPINKNVNSISTADLKRYQKEFNNISQRIVYAASSKCQSGFINDLSKMKLHLDETLARRK